MIDSMRMSLLIFGMLSVISMDVNAKAYWSQPEFEPLKLFLFHEKIQKNDWPKLIPIEISELPKSYEHLLTQPLMTLAIAEEYKRTPKIRTPLYTSYAVKQKKYSRGIIMIIDNNKERDDALLADKMGESSIAELAFITINCKSLPKTVTNEISTSQVPLGALLTKHNIKLESAKQSYFKIKCNKTLSKYLKCKQDQILYGRLNTLEHADTHQWVARTIEVLNEHHTEL